MTLRARLAIAAGVAVALAVLAVALTAYAGTKSELRRQVDISLRVLADRIAGGGAPGGPGAGTPAGPPGFLQGPFGRARAFGRPGPGGGTEPPGVGDEGLQLDNRRSGFGGVTGIVTVIHSNGTTYVPPDQAHQIPISASMRTLAASGAGEQFFDLQLGSAHSRVLVRGIGRDGAIAVALPLDAVDHTLSRELLLLLGIAAAGIAVAALLGVLVARAALAPISRFTAQAEAIAVNPERIEHERLEVSGSDELARLGATFNTTLDALERSIASQRNLVADASHELRTPIASVRANLQLMRDEALLSGEDRDALRRDMIDELDELTSLVADVVELARGSKPVEAEGDVRIDQITRQAIGRMRRRAPGIEVRADLEATLVRGEGSRIARAVANLLDNAAKWSPANGTVEVVLREGMLSVRDHGPGFNEVDLPYVFDRFHRAREARGRPGSGLGLAIARQAAEAHGGLVSAGNAPGGGALMRIAFGPALELAPEAQPLSAS